MKDSRKHTTVSSSSAPGRPNARRTTMHMQHGIVAAALVCLIAVTAWLTQAHSLRHSGLWLIGAGLGIVLYHARFGFTTAFRLFVATADGRGIRAQMLMLALASLLFAPILALNDSIGGAVAPASLSVLVGAFIFSIGMQLGGG